MCDIGSCIQFFFTKNLFACLKPDEKGYINKLVESKHDILLMEVEIWRLKIRAIWVSSGDQNTTFFHCYVEGRRNSNALWELCKNDGTVLSSQQDLEEGSKQHFQNHITDTSQTSILMHIDRIQCYPLIFSEEEGFKFYEPLSMQEMTMVLFFFSKSKSLGLGGWPVKFFVEFLDLMGSGLLDVVEESIRKGFVSGVLNDTFLPLFQRILNLHRSKTFVQFLYVI